MNKQNLSEFLFGLILTFFILDYIAPNVNWIILVLLSLGHLIFKWLSINIKNDQIYLKVKFEVLVLLSLS